MIAAEQVTVRPGGRDALRDATFRAARGEIVALTGAAGSGKSVLLKTLCLLHRPTRGRVLLDGLDLTACAASALSAAQARFGFSFQNLALFDTLDATDNVAFALMRRGVAAEEARERARTQLAAVGLAAAVNKLPHEMSGGMKRRLALARAMVARPEVGLYDDPFCGLDPVACARIARLIARSHQEAGGATVVAAGDPAPMLDVADRVVLLVDGAVAADLAARDFRAEAGEAVARFLGALPGAGA